MHSSSISIYIHWPFCKSKCPYCDFNSHVRENIDYQDWNNAYITELNNLINLENLYDRKITSIFFGGGTPSTMPSYIIENILKYIENIWKINLSEIEITMEANPTSVESKKFIEYKSVGINRLSLGIQSLIDKDLKFLGREHNVKEAINAIEITQKIFDKYSFDLIYARPEQSIEAWEKELQLALKFVDKHLSLYQLTIEKGTSFFSDFQKKKFLLPNDELSLEMYDITQDIMNSYNLPAYEISNHSIVGEECKHNLSYWQYKNYLGIGPGAHSRVNKNAIMMRHLPENWLQQIKKIGNGIQTSIKLTDKEIFNEIILMGLRLSEGISINMLKYYFGKNYQKYLSINKMNYLLKDNLLSIISDRITLTTKGFRVINKIIQYISQ